jgi:tripartite-type tricarboxylate transporter receptor subunit TctC
MTMKNIKEYFIVAILTLIHSVSSAQVLTVTIPFPPGGATDQIWRVLEPMLSSELSASGIVLTTEYIPGAGGSIGAAKVAKSNDYRLLFTSTSVAIGNYAYDPADLLTLGYFGTLPMFVAVPVSGPATYTDFIKECKQGTYSYATPGVGSTIHLMSLAFLQKINCTATHVPYKSTTPALPDLVAGRISFVVDFGTSATAELVTQGRLRHLKNLDTEEIKNWHILASSKNIDPALSASVNTALHKIFKDQSRVANLKKLGLQGVGFPVAQDFVYHQHKLFQKYLQDKKLQ